MDAVDRLFALSDPPDATVCFNDMMAVGVLSGLNSRGVSVPADVAVAGFENIDEARFSCPPLTTIAWDTQTIAEQAIALLAERQGSGEQPSGREISVGYQLIVRTSTG